MPLNDVTNRFGVQAIHLRTQNTSNAAERSNISKIADEPAYNADKMSF